MDQDAVCLSLVSPHPSTNLVELREPETLCVLHHHYSCTWNVHPHLHHRCGH